jgi:hypothetical protein
MNIMVFDVGSGERVLVRALSFRGDNDAAWRRAGTFAAKAALDELERSRQQTGDSAEPVPVVP